jgi:AraC family transcriptional regulator
MILHIKNMVCDRCILVVRQELERLDYQVIDINLGTANILPDPNPEDLQDITSAFHLLGFELIDTQKDQLVERVKNIIVELVHHTDLSSIDQSLLDIIASRLNKEYNYLSRIFSDSQQITIEKFIIQQKVEKVKEFLEYGEFNLNEIAYKMGYSSSAHLSNQFKVITGISPREYKATQSVPRKPLDKI